MRKILFICEHNSARSQMAEAFLNNLSGGKLKAESAGLEPGSINPFVAAVMKEENIDISDKSTQSVYELYKKGNQYDAVITVCSPEVSRKCPIFPGRVFRRNWPFDDPSAAEGTDDQKLEYVRKIRDQIREQVKLFVEDFEKKGFNLFLESDD